MSRRPGIGVFFGYITLICLFSVTLFGGFFAQKAMGATGILHQLSFYGSLKTSAGAAVADGDYDVVFKIYDAPSGGTLLWTGTYTGGNSNPVTTSNGFFSVLLGSGTGNALSLDFNSDTYYLGMTVGTDTEMTPRERIGAAAYAFNADTVDGYDSTDFVHIDTSSTVATSSVSTLLTINQQGSGNILDLAHSGVNVMTVTNAGALTLSGNATTTSNNGFNITNGCYSVNGICITSGGGGGGLATTSIDTSAELAAILGDETGSGGNVVFSTNPVLNGFRSNASSTIGDGTQEGGLTINGGATTTGITNLYGQLNLVGSTWIGFNTNGGIHYDDAYAPNSGNGTILMANASAEWITLQTHGLAPINFYTNDVERMRIDENGNVGIGTTSPSFDPNRMSNGLALSGGFAGITMASEDVPSQWTMSADYIGSTPFFEISNTLNATGLFRIDTSNNIRLGVMDDATAAGHAPLTITGGGNVGIGTTSPYAPLSVSADNFDRAIWSGPGLNAFSANIANESWDFASNVFTGTSGDKATVSIINEATTSSQALWVVGSAIDGGASGVYSIAEASGTTTSSQLSGVETYTINHGSGSVDEAISVLAGEASNDGGGSITNAYGVYANSQTAGNNNYAFYTDQVSGSNNFAVYATGDAASYFGGNVGIGTNNPSGRLSLGSPVQDHVLLLYDRGAGQGSYGMGIQPGTLEIYTEEGSGHLIQFGSDNGTTVTPHFSFTTDGANAGNAAFDGTLTASGAHISSDLIVDGNVGIGSSSPSVNLVVSGSNNGTMEVQSTDTTATALIINNTSSNGNYQLSVNGSANGFGSGGFDIWDGTNSRTSFLISPAGNVIIGGQISEGMPASPLAVNGGMSVGDGYASSSAPINGLLVQGNTSIGTTSSIAKLSVQANVGDANSTIFQVSSSTDTTSIPLFTITNGSSAQIRIGDVAGVDTTSGRVFATIGKNMTNGLAPAGGYYSVVQISPTLTFTQNPGNSYMYALDASLIATGTADITGGLNGAVANPEYKGSGTISDGIYGVAAGGVLSGSGSAENMYDFYAGAYMSNGSATSHYGGYFANPLLSGPATLANNYGIFLEDQTAGSLSNYAIYASGTAPSYFGGNVGIGTTTPASPLTLGGGLNFEMNDANFRITDGAGRDRVFIQSDTSSPGILMQDSGGSNSIALNVGGTSYFTQALSIGTSTSFSPLTIQSGVNVFCIDPASGQTFQMCGGGGNVGFSGNAVEFYSAPGSQLRAKIDVGGNFGIGTTSPFAKLSVEAEPTDTNRVLFAVASSTSIATTTLFSVSNTGDTDIAGGLGVYGSSTPGMSAMFFPPSQFSNAQIGIKRQDNSQSALLEFYPNGALTPSNVEWLMGMTNSTNNYSFSYWEGSQVINVLNVTNAGSVGIGTSTPTAQLSTTGTVRFSNFGAGTLQTDANGNLSVSSDERLKNIDSTFTKGLEEILKIEPINYTWKPSSGFDTANIYTGFSAQNVKENIPEAVGEDKNGFLTLSDRPILAAVVNAIKELYDQITESSRRIDTLETQVKDLQSQVNDLKHDGGGHSDLPPVIETPPDISSTTDTGSSSSEPSADETPTTEEPPVDQTPAATDPALDTSSGTETPAQ